MQTPASNMDVRRANRNRIYRLIHSKDGISRPEIAQQLQMSMPTVLLNCKSLLEQGLVRENGILQSTGGRKAVVLSVVPDVRSAIGIDVTRDHLVTTLVHLDGTVAARNQTELDFTPDREYVRAVGAVVDRFLADAGVGPERILGAGISIPGVLSPDGKTLMTSHVLKTENYSFSPLDERLGFPCVHLNDANAAGIAEMWTSDAERNFVYLSLSNSVGGALIWDGLPRIGDHQRSGEIGHMTLERGGQRCYCGKRGCLDAYCAATVLSSHTGGSLSAFFTKLKAGDHAVRIAWEDYLDYLSSAVNSLHMIFDYDIVIGGYLGSYIDDYIGELRAKAAHLNTFEDSGAYIKPCRHKTEASAVGAALMQIKTYIESI